MQLSAASFLDSVAVIKSRSTFEEHPGKGLCSSLSDQKKKKKAKPEQENPIKILKVFVEYRVGILALPC